MRRTLKTLETASDEKGYVISGEGWSDLFIYPGYEFKFKHKIHGFLTNFHLPKSSLLMLLSAYWGRKEILEVYKVAVDEKYRFFSFGDAMLLSI